MTLYSQLEFRFTSSIKKITLYAIMLIIYVGNRVVQNNLIFSIMTRRMEHKERKIFSSIARKCDFGQVESYQQLQQRLSQLWHEQKNNSENRQGLSQKQSLAKYYMSKIPKNRFLKAEDFLKPHQKRVHHDFPQLSGDQNAALIQVDENFIDNIQKLHQLSDNERKNYELHKPLLKFQKEILELDGDQAHPDLMVYMTFNEQIRQLRQEISSSITTEVSITSIYSQITSTDPITTAQLSTIKRIIKTYFNLEPVARMIPGFSHARFVFQRQNLNVAVFTSFLLKLTGTLR